MVEARSHYKTMLIQQFSSSNNARMYQYISSLRRLSTLPGTMSFNDVTGSNNSDKAELFNVYLYSVFTSLFDVHPPPDKSTIHVH